MNSLMHGSTTSPLAALSIACLFTLSCAVSDSDNKTSNKETVLTSSSALETTSTTEVRIHQSSHKWWQQVRVPSDTRIVAIDDGVNQWLLERTQWGDFVSNRYIGQGSDVRIIISNGTTPWISDWFPYLLQQPADSKTGTASSSTDISSQYHLIVHQHSSEWWQQVVPLVPINWVDLRYKDERWRLHREDYGHFTSNHHIEPGSMVELIFELQDGDGSPAVMKTARFHYLADQPAIEVPCSPGDGACPWDYVCPKYTTFSSEPQACTPRPNDEEQCSCKTYSMDCKEHLLCVEGPMMTGYCHYPCAVHDNCPSEKLCFQGICSKPICHLAIAKTETGYSYHASFVDAGWTNFDHGLSLTELKNTVYTDKLAGSCEMVSPQCDSLPQETHCATNQLGQKQEVSGPCAALRLMLDNIEQPESFSGTTAYEWATPQWQSTRGTCN